jgi:hypothetical protein
MRSSLNASTPTTATPLWKTEFPVDIQQNIAAAPRIHKTFETTPLRFFS